MEYIQTCVAPRCVRAEKVYPSNSWKSLWLMVCVPVGNSSPIGDSSIKGLKSWGSRSQLLQHMNLPSMENTRAAVATTVHRQRSLAHLQSAFQNQSVVASTQRLIWKIIHPCLVYIGGLCHSHMFCVASQVCVCVARILEGQAKLFHPLFQPQPSLVGKKNIALGLWQKVGMNGRCIRISVVLSKLLAVNKYIIYIYVQYIYHGCKHKPPCNLLVSNRHI